MQQESEKEGGRDGRMEGVERTVRGRASVCAYVRACEREREGAQCSILRASRHCAGWEKRQLNPRSRKKITDTRIKQ